MDEKRVARFWRKVKIGTPEECWEWTGARTRKYGSFQVSPGKQAYASRVAWQISNGTIPDGMHVRHKCDNPPCVNPSHLELGTHADNMRDKAERGGQPRGESAPHAKLTESDVVEIRALVASGNSQASVARRFDVCQRLVWGIVHRKRWRHVR